MISFSLLFPRNHGDLKGAFLGRGFFWGKPTRFAVRSKTPGVGTSAIPALWGPVTVTEQAHNLCILVRLQAPQSIDAPADGA